MSDSDNIHSNKRKTKVTLRTATRIIVATLAALLVTTSAQAGANECVGVVKTGPEWTQVLGDPGPNEWPGCRFRTASKAGQRILRECPHGSRCWIGLPLSHRNPAPVTKIERVDRE